MTPDELRRSIIDELAGLTGDVALLAGRLVTARAQIDEWRGHLLNITEILRPYGDAIDSPVELAGKAAAEIQQLRTDRDRWVDSARAASDWLVKFSDGYPMGTRYAEIIERIEQDRADLARLRERAVMLPEGWRQQLWSHFDHRETRESRSALNALIESWRPSTGDTRERKPIDDATKAAVLAAIEAGQYIACGDGPEYWPDCERCEATGRITECPDCDGVGKIRPAALPEGHTEQTGDGNG